MRRAIVTQFGPAAEVVRVHDYTPRPLTHGEVQVEIAAAAINPSDLITIAGTYRSRTPLPLTPGFEGVGRVRRIGPGVETLAIGDRVLPIGSPGTWQQVKTTDARWCFRVQSQLTDEQAALSYINPLTAIRMVQDFAIARRASMVVVNAAGSAIAGMLARLLHKRGIRPVALIRGETGRLETTGPIWARVLSTSDPEWQRELARLTDGGPEVAYDAVGGTEAAQLMSTLRTGGRLVHYGLLSGQPLPAGLRETRPDVRIHLYRLRDWVHRVDHDALQTALDEAGQLVLDGTAGSTVQNAFPLEQVGEAIFAAQEHGGRGKVLLLP